MLIEDAIIMKTKKAKILTGSGLCMEVTDWFCATAPLMVRQMGKIHCSSVVKRIAEGISGGKRIFCGKSLENAKFLFKLL